MASLSWEQVTAWRLSQHSLIERSQRDQMVDVVSRVCGLQAQLMSAAALQLWARVADITADDINNALWDDKTLVKTWAMRGTLHWIAARDFPLYVAAAASKARYKTGSWLKYHGVTLDEIDAIIEGARTLLTGEGLTRQQLANAMVEHTGKAHLAELLGSGWGALLKPAAFHGYLCFGPDAGQNVTFVSPEKWLGAWEAVDPDEALKEVCRRFLNAYGPATVDEFARWWGFEASKARKVYKALGAEIQEVSVEGYKGWMLTLVLDQLEKSKPAQSVRLLPHFDPYTIAIAKHSKYLMPEAYKAKVYRTQGWISPVVLINGRIAGVWDSDKQKSKVVVSIEMFESPDKKIKQGIESEAQGLRFQFADRQIEVVFS